MSSATHSDLMARHTLDRFRKYGENCMQIRGFEKHETVTIYSCDKKEWIIPWARFESSARTVDDRGERIEIHFALHHAILEGENFEELTRFMKTREISRLRALPKEFRATIPEGEPFIMRIQLKALSDKTSESELNLPF